MKKLVLFCFLVFSIWNAHSQWMLGGQNVPQNQGQLGSINNEPIQIITSNQERMRVNDQNETFTHVAWGVQGKPGFVGIGLPNIGNPVPYCMLHINGPNPAGFQSGGWRP
jgi:hypothetical protein